MRNLTFDLDVLRSFVMGVELGSFARAADRLGRSTSAVSAQLKKLEDQTGVPVLRKSGRGMVLTPTGELLLGYARRLLELNDATVTALRRGDLEGSVSIGLQEDFSEVLLAGILGDFTRNHPRVRIEARTVRNGELLDLVVSGRVDLALAWDSGVVTPHHVHLGEVPLCWIGSYSDETAVATEATPMPLVVFDAPCLMRSVATAALDRAQIPWRIAFTSLGLGGIWAAVGAGLGVSVRTRIGMPATLRVRNDLPNLPSIGLRLHRARAEPSPVVQELSEIVQARLHDLLLGR